MRLCEFNVAPMSVDPLVGLAGELRQDIAKRIVFARNPIIDTAYSMAAKTVAKQREGNKGATLASFDLLLFYLLVNFECPAAPRDLRPAVPHKRDEKAIGNIAAFPIALVSELMTTRRIRLNVREVANWKPFAERYGSALLCL